MKKISLLLLCVVFLLFPVIIYFGNLADNPESKRIVVYLRDLVGMSASKEVANSDEINMGRIPASYTHIGLVESWRNLGAGDFADLLKLVATQSCRVAWQSTSGDFLADSLHSTAFFSSSWSFWQAQQGKLKLIGYYQPWIDVLLLIQVIEFEGGYKAIAFGLTEPNSDVAPTIPSAMAQELTNRLKHAEQVFRVATQNPDATAKMLNVPVVKKAQDRLNQYVTDLRKKLAATDSENQSRSAILEWLSAARAGQIKEIQELTQQSNDWLKYLQPVQLLKIDSENWLLAASDPNQAERVLLVQLSVKEHKAKATEVLVWDAATAGDTP
jgi:hypothetical protein